MKITAGLGSVDDYPMYVEAGADECFCGYVPFAWAEKYGVLNPLNRREVRAYNVQIGSYEELKILGNMRKYYQVPVAITFNSLSYTPEQYPVVGEIIGQCHRQDLIRSLWQIRRCFCISAVRRSPVGSI